MIFILSTCRQLVLGMCMHRQGGSRPKPVDLTAAAVLLHPVQRTSRTNSEETKCESSRVNVSDCHCFGVRDRESKRE